MGFRVGFSNIRGKQKANDAAVIAAAGGHNLLTLCQLHPFVENAVFLDGLGISP
jgi:hypothetical protein